MSQNLLPLPEHDASTPWPSNSTPDWPTGPLPATTNQAALQKILDAIDSPDLARHGKTFALLVSHKGKLALEKYGPSSERLTWFGEMKTDPWPKEEFGVESRKSFVHACFGILLRLNLLKTVQQPAHPWVPEWSQPNDPRREITIEHLLQMRSGLEWEEAYVAPAEHPWPAVLEMIWGDKKNDAAHFAASFPLQHKPGSHFYYSSGTTNILVSILYRILDIPPELPASERQAKFTKWIGKELFEPLGIKEVDLRFDEKGLWFGSSYVYLRSREFLRFGELYLRDGVFNNNRILPAGFADTARSLQSVIPAQDPFSEFQYGQQWWIGRDSYGGFAALGYQGQFTYVIPGLDVVIVRNGETPMEILGNVIREQIWALVDALAGKEGEWDGMK